MVHPIVQLLLTQPRWLAEHAQAYAELVTQEAALAAAAWQRRAMLLMLAAACGLLGAGLAGVAVMLWALAPALQIHQQWVLVGTPLLPLLACAGLVLAWRRSPPVTASAVLRQQWRADLEMVRSTGAA